MTGKDLQTIRNAWGFTQTEMAKLLGCHPQTVSEMERDRKPISQTLVNLIECEKRWQAVKKILDWP